MIRRKARETAREAAVEVRVDIERLQHASLPGHGWNLPALSNDDLLLLRAITLKACGEVGHQGVDLLVAREQMCALAAGAREVDETAADLNLLSRGERAELVRLREKCTAQAVTP